MLAAVASTWTLVRYLVAYNRRRDALRSAVYLETLAKAVSTITMASMISGTLTGALASRLVLMVVAGAAEAPMMMAGRAKRENFMVAIVVFSKGLQESTRYGFEDAGKK